MAQENTNKNMNKSQKPQQQVRGSELRNKMNESREKGEEFRRERHGNDELDTTVNRPSSDTHKDMDKKTKAP